MKAGKPLAVPPFLKRHQLQLAESAVSLVQRHSSSNRAKRILHVLRLIETLCGEPVTDVRDIVFSRKALRAVEHLTGLDEGALDAQFVQRLQSTHLVTGHHVWRRAFFRPKRQAICPICIRSQGYAKVQWEFSQAPVCTEHGVAMLETCPSCSFPLRFSRRRLTHCEKCNFALEDHPGALVSESARQIAELVQNPSMVAMGDADSTAPIDAEDLADLLRLCLPPSPGRPSSYGLTGHPGDVPVADRVQALDRLGSALDKRRIDSATVRQRVIERWPGLCFLPPSSQLEQLRDTLLEMEVDGELMRLLCFGDEAKGAKRASVVFDGRPPQLNHDLQVADFLGVDVHAMRMLQGRDELTKTEEDVGYDMDHVLALQRRLAAWCSPAVVDQALGMQGLTQALYDIKLLVGAQSSDGTLVGIQPQSFCALMSRIQSVICPDSADAEFSVPLAQAASYHMEPQDIAWVVSQVANGSLAAYSWPSPQRLTFLRVDDRRLRSLAMQLSYSSPSCVEQGV